MKKKLANLLRRWANKLSPICAPNDHSKTVGIMLRHSVADVIPYRVDRHYTRQELEAIEHDPDLAAVIDMDARRQLLNDMGLALYQGGAIEFHTEPECCPDSHDVLVAICRAVTPREII